MSLAGGNLSVSISVTSDAASATTAIVQGRGEEHTITLSIAGVAIHEPGGMDGRPTDPGSTLFAGSAGISATLADAIRDGEAHLLLPLAGGVLRGQIARPLPEPPAAEPQPLTGSYALLLIPQQEVAEKAARPAPAGAGHGWLHLSEDRRAELVVTLPLGVPVRWRGTLPADGQLTIDAPVRKARGGGSVKGTLTVLRTGAAYSVKGTLDWRRPPADEGARFAQGFKLSMSVEGEFETFRWPRSNSYLLSLAEGSLREPISVSLIRDGVAAIGMFAARSPRVFQEQVQIPLLRIDGANPHNVTFYVVEGSGFFRGTFRHPRTGSLVPFAGRMLFGADRGAGAFTSRGTSGTLSISPIPRPGSSAAHTLTSSATDPDVVMLSASAFVPDTSYDVELVARPVSVIPADGIYDFDLVRRKVSDVGFMVITSRITTIALQRNASFTGVRVYSSGAPLSDTTIRLPAQ
jgi:hypothetical protein